MRLLLGVCLLAVLWDDSLAVLKSGRLRLLNLDDGGKTDYVRPTASVVDKHIPTLSKEVSQRVGVAANLTAANHYDLFITHSWSLD